MNVSETIKSFSLHMRSTIKPITIKNYEFLLKKFEAAYWERPLESICSDEISTFLEDLTASFCKSTRRLRYAQMKSFFNFAIDHFNLDIKNPCSTQYLSKAFKMPSQRARKKLDKELVDEMIYSAKSLRDRLIFELQSRCGLRVGELLKLTQSIGCFWQKTCDSTTKVWERFRSCIYAGTDIEQIEWVYKPEEILSGWTALPCLLLNCQITDQRIRKQIKPQDCPSWLEKTFSYLCES